MVHGETSFFKKYEKYFVGIALSLIVLFFIYLPKILESQPEQYISIQLCQYSGTLNYEFVDVMSRYVTVPDYKADVFITPIAKEVNLNSDAAFTFRVVDEGIIKLNATYFYIFLFDPENELRAIFPCFCGEDTVKFEISGYRCSYSSGRNDCFISESDRRKFSEWEQSRWFENEKEYHCTDQENFFCVNIPDSKCVSRTALFDGKINNKAFHYSFRVDKIGTWQIVGFVFDKEYKTRDNLMLTSELQKNAVAFTQSKFEVVKEFKEKESNLALRISTILTILITFGSIITYCIFLYEWTKRNIIKYKYQILLIITAIAVLFLATFIICKLSCP